MEQKTDAQKTILIVEDEKNIVDILRFNLQREGYRTVEAYDGADGLEKARKENPDLILLDVMLPKMIGFDVCRTLREEGNNVPVIILTAREEEADKVLGLEIGADDYITKPFSVRELAARVKSLLRRVAPQQESEPQTLRAGDIMIDITNYEAFKGGEKLSLTLKEFELLKVLVLSRGKVLTRDFLLDRIWGYEYYGETRTVDVHIKRLREKVEGVSDQWALKTVWGVGYKFETVGGQTADKAK